MSTLKLAVVTDEIDQDLESAVKFGMRLGVFRYELRSGWGSRFPLFSNEQIECIKRIKKDYNIEFTAVSPGLFKVPLDTDEMKEHRGSLLEKTLFLAEELEVKRIIIFGVKRSDADQPADYERVLDVLGESSLKAVSKGFNVNLENEPGWWADTSENVYRMLKDLEGSGLKLNWDVGNLFNAGEESYCAGYQLLRKYIDNVHVKDVKKTDGGNIFVPVGYGEIDWKNQLKDLNTDGYKGNIVIETHCEPKREATCKSIEYVRNICNI
jgi:sugar phosphate isomerase/epimerase